MLETSDVKQPSFCVAWVCPLPDANTVGFALVWGCLVVVVQRHGTIHTCHSFPGQWAPNTPVFALFGMLNMQYTYSLSPSTHPSSPNNPSRSGITIAPLCAQAAPHPLPDHAHILHHPMGSQHSQHPALWRYACGSTLHRSGTLERVVAVDKQRQRVVGGVCGGVFAARVPQ